MRSIEGDTLVPPRVSALAGEDDCQQKGGRGQVGIPLSLSRSTQKNNMIGHIQS
jgi:hypothetical protein